MPRRWSSSKRQPTCGCGSKTRDEIPNRRFPPATECATRFFFDTNAPEQLIVLTNAHARYTFTSRGGGLKSVELLDFPETVSPRWKKKMADGRRRHIEHSAAVPVLAILGESSLVGDGNFTLTKIDDGVRAEKSFTTDCAS